MANPTPLSRTSGLARLSVEDIKLFVGRSLGITGAEFTTDEDVLMLDLINREVNDWRVQVKSTKPIGQAEQTYEWGGGGGDDPASGDTAVELPAAFGELQEQEVQYVDATTGQPVKKLTIITVQDFRDSFSDGENFAYTDGNPVAYIYQESDNRRRILHVYPAPEDGTVLSVPYWTEADQVTGDADVIEADPDVHDGIRFGVAQRWAALDGNDEAMFRWERLRNQKWQLFSNRVAQEDKRSRYVKPFSGYPGHTDTPDRQYMDRR